ncbi:hypothetical protein MMC22_009485 [Lobaria immixta]|nr:hypothetical protein [Lobaria immixta]
MLNYQCALPLHHAMLLYLCALMAWLPTASAQSTAPSNTTLTLPPEQLFLLITTQQTLRLRIGLLIASANATEARLSGPLIATDGTQDVADLKEGDISFISCDPTSYPGPLVAKDTIKAAVSKNPIAIVLYSNISNECSFNNTNGFSYTSLYTSLNTLSNTFLHQFDDVSAKIMLYSKPDNSNNNNNNTTSDGSFTKSPTTAVAMIILYSITGIITALFLIIILVGAIRAHRHPERYGPRHVIGRPRQSRAKGIARAMLETIPIVKFGDKDDKPVTSPSDVELGPAEGARHSGSSPVPKPGAPITEGSVHSGEGNTEPELVKTETVDGTHDSERRKTEDGVNADNGLACSVCTDDFVKGQDIRVLPCDHKFHPECIDPWLLNVSGTCPLCRVDLRPTTSHPTVPDFPESSHNPTTHSHTNLDPLDPSSTAPPASSTNGAGSSTPPATTDSTPHTNRRSRTGLSLYLQNTLNRRRMRDATPEERIEALRTLRTAHRAHESESAGLTEQRPRNRMSARLSRAFSSSRPVSGVPVITPQRAPDPADVPERER